MRLLIKDTKCFEFVTQAELLVLLKWPDRQTGFSNRSSHHLHCRLERCRKSYLEQLPESYINGQPSKELKDSRSIVHHTSLELAQLERDTAPFVQKELREIQDRSIERDKLHEDMQKQKAWLKPQLMFGRFGKTPEEELICHY